MSLVPSVTEILFAIGAQDRLVGVTDFCDYPPAARRKPSVGGMLSPSLETLVALKPDLVVATTRATARRRSTSSSGSASRSISSIQSTGAPTCSDLIARLGA